MLEDTNSLDGAQTKKHKNTKSFLPYVCIQQVKRFKTEIPSFHPYADPIEIIFLSQFMTHAILILKLILEN